MPRPEKHVLVCTQMRPPMHPRPSCSAKGCAPVYEEFLWQLQQRELFGKVQITSTGCMGPCSEGPSVLVYPDNVMYGGVSKEDVTEIFDKHLIGGEKVERLEVSPEFW